MMGSGTHSPATLSAVVQAPGDSGRPGSSSVGTQWEPPQVGLHAAKTVGSNTAGPVQGQVSRVGGLVGASQAKLQAPVAAVGLDAVGLKHGMHRSGAAHTLWGSPTASATEGRQVERHRPSAPAIDTQD